MESNVLRRIAGTFSFVTALFVFQACYGTPQDLGLDVLIEGKVVSSATGNPLPGIRVSPQGLGQYQFTNAEGSFSMYTLASYKLTIRFEDVDGEANGRFAARDTLIDKPGERVYLSIGLEPLP